MAIQCPKCGSTNPDNARFCWNDGEKLVTTGFQPFRFRSGAVANSLSDLVRQTDAHWEDGKYHLYQWDLAIWLASIGRVDLASEARSIVSSERDQDIGLEKFLQHFGPDAPPSPQLQVTPTALDFGTVDGEGIASSNPTRQFRITNTGRGHLYGTIQSSDAWLTVEGRFSGNAVAITARATREGKQATIQIDSNGGEQAVPVRMNPVRPWYRIGVLKYSVAFFLIGLGELFPAIALVNSAMNQGDATVFFGLLGTVWGALIGLGIACLLTRIKIRWKGYLALFLVLPFSNVCIFVMLYLLFLIYLSITEATPATPGGAAVVSLIVSPLISCFYTYCKSRYIGIDVLY